MSRLRYKFGKNDFKDLIRPLRIEKSRKFAVFDENSLVLRIILHSDSKWETIDENTNPVIREIKEIFKDITEKENSVLFTLKELYMEGNIKRRET